MELDDAKFVRAVERRRAVEGISWRELGRQLDLSASTLSRLARGRRPDLETFLRLLTWIDEPVEQFLVSDSPAHDHQDTLAAVGRALDDDPGLSPEDARAIHEIVHLAYRRLRQP